MASKGTWVKLYRSIIDWEHFDDAQMVKLYLYLICAANVTALPHKGVTVGRGQVATSYRQLADVMGVGVATIDRMLKKFEKSGEAERERNAPFLLITLNNYNSFQNSGTETERNRNKNGTKSEQKRNASYYNNKEYKNIRMKECKNERNKTLPSADEDSAGGWKSRRDF